MSKYKLKTFLFLLKFLVLIKRGLLYLFFFIFRHFLEKTGKLIAHLMIFPFYKLYLKYFLTGGHYFGLIFNRRVLFAIILLMSVFFMGSESKTYSSNKYIGGRGSLLFQFFSSEENSEYIEEEVSVNIPQTFQQGLSPAFSSSLPLSGEITAPTQEFVSYNENLTGLSAPPILPGVEIGGRREFIKYVVQAGDSIPLIAKKFQINQETILIENKLTAKSIIRPGDVLTILPVSGVSHKVQKGDSWTKIAAAYKVDAQKIIEFNNLNEKELPVGEILVIPDGKKIISNKIMAARSTIRPGQINAARPSSVRPIASGMLWPTIGRRISQYFTWRHPGIDIPSPKGTPIYVSDDGVVEKSGWNAGGYGFMILINHGNGIKTRYAHNSKLFAQVGDDVRKGDVISLMGSTGRSTGSHLHFEVIVGGVRVNPFLYVR